jgi:hypothetical protein
MPVSLMIASAFLLGPGANEPPIIVKAYPWAPFISPMGEPFRPPTTGEAPLARWFRQADQNADGALTSEEMQHDADRFFTRLDSNQDGRIDPDEIKTYEWEIAPEIQVNSDWRQARGEAANGKRKRDAHDGYRADGLQGAARYGLLNIPQPVASADADFNRVITLAEFKQAASVRFKLLDGRGQGQVTLPELEARLPDRPKGRRVKRAKDAVDTRVGLPLPDER